MTTAYTHRLRTLAERTANGVAETKGYNGAALNPWRVGKRQVKSLYKKNGRLTWSDESHCSGKAKGYPATVNVVDNNGDLSTEQSAADKARSAKASRQMQDATGELQTATPWQGQVEEARINKTLPATPWATQSDWPVMADARPMAECGDTWVYVDRVAGFTHATAEEREAALAEQVLVHGRTYRLRHAKQCKAWDKKQTSWKQLTNACEQSHNWVSLDDRPDDMDEEPAWTPTTGDRMAELMDAEAKRTWKQTLDKVLATLTAKQREAVELTAMGVTLNGAQRQALLLARSKAGKG